MFQRKYLLFLGALALLAIIWTIGWFWLADRFKDDIDRFASEQRGQGIVLEWDEVVVSGYPVRFDTRFVSPRGRWATPERNIAWFGADTTVRAFADGPNGFRFRAPGAHRFEVRERGRTTAIDTTAEGLRGRLGIGDNGRADSLRGETAPLTARVENGPSFTVGKAAFDWSHETVGPDAEAIHPEDQRQSLTFALDDIDLSDVPLDRHVSETLGTAVQRAAGRIVLRGDLDPGAISPDRLSRWRDAGGTVEAEQIQLLWGPVQFFGDGTLSLDAAMQPEGAFTARIAGLDKLIDLLESEGRVRPQQAAIARIALAVLTRAPAGGGPPAATVPVTLQNRVVSVGPVPLLTLDPVVWE